MRAHYVALGPIRTRGLRGRGWGGKVGITRYIQGYIERLVYRKKGHSKEYISFAGLSLLFYVHNDIRKGGGYT